MDIKLLPSVTMLPINENRAPQKQAVKKIRVKGKIIHLRSSRNDENGRSIITIITDTHENQLKDIVNLDVIVQTVD